MQIFILGVNHKNTPVELRERLAFQQGEIGKVLRQLTGPSVSEPAELTEAIILSTCNRVEIYGVARNGQRAVQQLMEFISVYHNVPLSEFGDHLYALYDYDAVEHIFSVTSGIDSMVIGESQIQGQVKTALELAQKAGTAGALLSTLFGSALRVGKRARSETEISTHSLSISGAAVNLVKAAYSDVSELNILVIGLGEISLLAIKSLFQAGARNLNVINRSLERMERVKQFPVRVFGFDRLEAAAAQADVVICSTGAPHLVLSVEQVKAVQKERSRPLLIIDIAVPRDVDPEIGELPNVTLYNIDELKTQVEENLERRCNEIKLVRGIIGEECDNFWSWYKSLQAKPVITQLRQKAEAIREHELQRALRRFESSLSEKDAAVVHELSRRIVNKILHQPLTRIREEACNGNARTYTATIQNLFDLESTPPGGLK